MATKISYATKVAKISSANGDTNYGSETTSTDYYYYVAGGDNGINVRDWVLFKFSSEDIPQNLTTAQLSVYCNYWTSGGSGYNRSSFISPLGEDFTEGTVTYNTKGNTVTFQDNTSSDWEASSSSSTKTIVYTPQFSYTPTYAWKNFNLPNIWFTRFRDGIYAPSSCGIISGCSHYAYSSVSVKSSYYTNDDATYKPYITYTYTPQTQMYFKLL